jgi:hypothetical protein
VKFTYLFEPPFSGMCSTIVGARDSVPSFGALKKLEPEPGRGGGVASMGLGGLETVVVGPLEGVLEEVGGLEEEIEVICAGFAVNDGGGAVGRT